MIKPPSGGFLFLSARWRPVEPHRNDVQRPKAEDRNSGDI